jgi:hypothetical protein
MERANKMSEETKQKIYDGVHVCGGILAALIYPFYPFFSVTALVAFGVFEFWQAKETGDVGSHDFWGGVLGYFIGLGIVLVLKIVGVI